MGIGVLDLGKVVGDDGFSPIIEVVEDTIDTYRLKITTATQEILTPDLRGDDGDDGFAPIIEVVEDTIDTYRLKITTATQEILTPNLRYAALFSPGVKGLIKGADPDDPQKNGYIQAMPDGEGKVIGFNELFDRILQNNWPIGSPYIQRLNDPAPVERGLPGDWEAWSHRADAYGLSSSVPARSDYVAGYNYSAGAVVMYHLAGDDYALFKAKEAITAAPAQLDPVKWDKVAPGLIIERRFLQGWTDADFSIGKQIEDGSYKGMYVTEIIVPGGKFPSIEGGNRGTFISGGVMGDTMRDFEGTFDFAWARPWMGGAYASGVFSDLGGGGTNIRTAWNEGNGTQRNKLIASKVVPTGLDNAPRTLSTRLWRRTG